MHISTESKMKRTQKLSAIALAIAVFSLIHVRILKPYHENEIRAVNDRLYSAPIVASNASGEQEHNDFCSQTTSSVCGRRISIATHEVLPLSSDHLVVIGQDNFHHVQTNNHINAILHAMDFAYDNNATLTVSRTGWAMAVLRLFFGGEETVDRMDWEKQIKRHLNVNFLDDHGVKAKESNVQIVEHKTGDEMYYYHTNQSISTIIERRVPVLRYLWSHPTTNIALDAATGGGKDMCSAILPSLPNKYVVLHSRWMKKGGCLNRLGSLTNRIKHNKGINIDHKSPCLLQPTYIERILRSSNALDYPIYVISDGLNPDIVHQLQRHPIFGDNVMQVETNRSWVGGDMMLGVFSSIFIGTPISTLSGNIARARMALGFDPKTNYLFPIKDKEGFACTDGTCLYDVQSLNHYVG